MAKSVAEKGKETNQQKEIKLKRFQKQLGCVTIIDIIIMERKSK
jgi:hypothetical protein